MRAHWASRARAYCSEITGGTLQLTLVVKCCGPDHRSRARTRQLTWTAPSPAWWTQENQFTHPLRNLCASSCSAQPRKSTHYAGVCADRTERSWSLSPATLQRPPAPWQQRPLGAPVIANQARTIGPCVHPLCVRSCLPADHGVKSFRVKLSANLNSGFVRFWRDGTLRTRTATSVSEWPGQWAGRTTPSC